MISLRIDKVLVEQYTQMMRLRYSRSTKLQQRMVAWFLPLIPMVLSYYSDIKKEKIKKVIRWTILYELKHLLAPALIHSNRNTDNLLTVILKFMFHFNCPTSAHTKNTQLQNRKMFLASVESNWVNIINYIITNINKYGMYLPVKYPTADAA